MKKIYKIAKLYCNESQKILAFEEITSILKNASILTKEEEAKM
jgi:hypothetical protein